MSSTLSISAAARLNHILVRCQGWRLWVGLTLLIIAAVEGVVAIVEAMLLGAVTADYLLVGLITAAIVTPPSLRLVKHLVDALAQPSHHLLMNSLGRAESRLQLALDTSREGILMLDQDGRLLAVNRRFGELWQLAPALSSHGNSRQLLLGIRHRLATPRTTLAALRQMLESDEAACANVRCQDGRVLSCSTRAISSGIDPGRIWFFQDITEQIQTRALLEEREELYRNIVTQANDAITVNDPVTLAYVEFNDAACASVGYTREEFAQLRLPDITADLSEARIRQLMPRAGEAGIINLETRHRHKDGSLRNVLVCARTIELHNRQLLISTWSDVTDLKRVEAALRQSEQKLTAIVDNVDAFIYLKDLNGNYLFANRTAREYVQHLAQASGGYNDETVFDAATIAQIREHNRRVLETGEAHCMDVRYTLLSGESMVLQTTKVPLRDDDGNIYGICGISVDITARQQAAEKLQLAASVFTHAREGILIASADGVIIDVNESFTRITGYRRDEVLGRTPNLLKSGHQGDAFYSAMWQELHENKRWQGEIWNRHKNGQLYAVMETISAVPDSEGRTQHYVSLFSDITQIKEHERQLEHIAHYDALTTLPNRLLLADRLQQAMAQAQRRGQRFAVAYLDLDGFKAINDQRGHDLGDHLLIAVAQRMKQTLRDGDTLARLGGDEFVAVLLDVDDMTSCAPMLDRLLQAASHPVMVSDFVLQVSASLGLTFYPQSDDIDADHLLRQADQAMYQAKLAGKNRYHVFDADQDRSIRGHHERLKQIQQALLQREFVLHYQPKVNMRSGEVIGAEALIRWQHPLEGLLLPAAFLPVIEGHPLALTLGEWVIDTALGQIQRWQALGIDIPVSVNVSAYHVQQPSFVARLGEILAAHRDVPPSRLVLEILETSALEDILQASRVIDACRSMGVTFALDDFGTGYSSLTYLKRLPVDEIKVDQSFVRDMLDDPDDLAIVDGVIGFATAFRRRIIAEGMETAEHGRMLLQLGCEQAQGYGIARPMPAQQFPAWAASWQTDPTWLDLPAINRDLLPVLFASVEHRLWAHDVKAYLNGESQTLPTLDPDQCRFGQWLASEGSTRYTGQAEFEAIDRQHRQLHALAVELVQLQACGESDTMRRRMQALLPQQTRLQEHMRALTHH